MPRGCAKGFVKRGCAKGIVTHDYHVIVHDPSQIW